MYGTSRDKQLLGFALRDHFGFLVSHFCLLSESIDLWFVFLLPLHPASAGRIWQILL